MGRKPFNRVSTKAQSTMAVAQVLGLRYLGDPNWAIAEATTRETPVGDVHLHWMSHRGQGHWNLITNPKWRGEICGTARCRRVVIEPMGGENESANLGEKSFDVLRDEWLWTKPGAVCSWPQWSSLYPPYVHIVESWLERSELRTLREKLGLPSATGQQP